MTGFVAEHLALHFCLCCQKRQAPHCLTCIGKLWLAACFAKVCEAPRSNVSTTLLVSTFAVAASTFAVASVPGSLTLPSSEDSPEHFRVKEASASVSAALEGPFSVALDYGLLSRPSSSPSPEAVAASASEQLDAASDSPVPSLVRVAATEGSVAASDSQEAAEHLALSSADSSADAAADLYPALSGSASETISDGDAFYMTVAAAEELTLGEGLAASSSLEDIASGVRGVITQYANEQTRLSQNGYGASNYLSKMFKTNQFKIPSDPTT